MTLEKETDDLDVKIIKALLRNSRRSFSEIAKECNTSAATIKKRFSRLVEEKIITGSTVFVDLAHFGVECDANVFINVNPDEVSHFLRDLQQMPGGFFAHAAKLNDKCEVIAWAPIRSLKDIEKLRESLKHHSAVVDSKINIWTYMKVYPDNLTLENRTP